MNILKKTAQRRRNKKQTKRLAQISYVFGLIRTLEKSSLLVWNAKTRQLFIAEPLAVVFISQGMERWQSFLNNVYLYKKNQLLRKAWDNLLLRKQKEAISQFQKSGGKLTKAEFERIKRAVRKGLTELDVPEPSIDSFDFFILADKANDKDHNAIVWVGTYDPDNNRLDMAQWDSIKHNFEIVKNKEDEQE